MSDTTHPWNALQATVFISYSRKDGEDFAADLRHRLEDEGLTLWRDRDRMEGGVSWWNQITEALDAVKFMVLVATSEAMQSPIVKKEWRYARQQGVCVYPVQVPGLPIDFDALPRWMRDSHFYNLDKEWETFVSYLKSPCTAPRVPFMPPDLPQHFVPRPREFDALKSQLLDANFDNPVAITTALKGAGGFGKTTMAAALCHDEDVQTAFDDGVLWVTLGEKPDIVGALSKLYRALTDDNPGFIDIEEGVNKLAERLADLDCLIVIDDVWNSVHLRPFLRGGKRCARLVTTRFAPVAVDAKAKTLNVDEMTTTESVQMLLAGIGSTLADATPFQALAARLGEWALLLEVTNGLLRKRMSKGADLVAALNYVNRALGKRGVVVLKTGFNEAAVQVLDASLEQVDIDEQRRLFELAIFTEDSLVPLTSVMALWGMDDLDAEGLIDQFDDLSFVRFDAERGTFRMHDVVREVLYARLENPAHVHARLTDAYGDLTALPDTYAWRNIAYHLMEAGRAEKLRELLLDFDWLQTKLGAQSWRLDMAKLDIDTIVGTDVNALIIDYGYLPLDETLWLVKSALELSSHIVADDSSLLGLQLSGRLWAHKDNSEIAQLWTDAMRASTTWHWSDVLPKPPLENAGGALKRILAHPRGVESVAWSPDGTRLATGSWDGVARVWDVTTGELLHRFTDHDHAIRAMAWSPNSKLLATGSDDKTVRIWDAVTFALLYTFSGVRSWVQDVGWSPDGLYLVAGFERGIAIVWRVDTGQLLLTLIGHESAVHSVAWSPDGKHIATGSHDETVRIWDAVTGKRSAPPLIHNGGVKSVAWSPDGTRLAAGSHDGTVMLWDADGRTQVTTFTGHRSAVWSVAWYPDGAYLATGSSDRTTRIWSLATGANLYTLAGNTSETRSVAWSPDGMNIVTGSLDGEARIWDLAKYESVSPDLAGHKETVNCLAWSPDGTRIATGSEDQTLRVWDTQTGEHFLASSCSSSIISLAWSLHGKHVLAGSSRWTAQNWDITTGEGETVYSEKKQYQYPTNLVMWSPDGTRIATWTRNKTLRLLDPKTNEDLELPIPDKHFIIALAWSPEATQLATGSWNNTVHVWDTTTGDAIRTLMGLGGEVKCLAWSPDGIRLVAGSSFGAAQVWNITNGQLLHSLGEHAGAIQSVSWSPDSTHLVTGSADRTLRIWNLNTGDCMSVLPLDSPVHAVAWSPDGKYLAVGDQAGRVIWLRYEEG